MSRKRTPLGTWGQITRTQLKPKIWRARARFRSFDGKMRLYEAQGASGPKAHRIGRHLRISRTDFNEWIASTEDHFV